MNNIGFIENIIKKAMLKRIFLYLFCCFISFIIFVGVFFNTPNYFFEIPKINTMSDANSYFNNGHEWGLINLEGSYNTGHSLINEVFDFKTFGYINKKKFIYKIIEVKDGFLLIKAPYRESGRELNKEKLVARFVRINDEASRVINDIIPRNIDFITEDKFFSKFPSTFFEIVDYDFNKAGYILFYSFCAFLIFLALFSQSISYFRNYKKTRIYKKLKLTKEQEENINNQFINNNYLFILKDCCLFNDYFIGLNGLKVVFAKNSMLTSICKKTINKKCLFFCKKEFLIVLNYKDKRSFEIKVKKEEQLDEVLNKLSCFLEEKNNS